MTEEFPRAVTRNLTRLQHANTYRANQEALMQHMFDISGDPQGSDPRTYLAENDVQTLLDFVKMAKHLGMPNATDLSLRSSWVPALPAWNSPKTTARSGLVKVLFYPKQSHVRGYPFGHLATEPDQAVAIGEDGLLYSKRGPELRRSKGDGWGRLPDMVYIDPLRKAGMMHGVHYRNFGVKSLSDLLLGRIPPADRKRLIP